MEIAEEEKGEGTKQTYKQARTKVELGKNTREKKWWREKMEIVHNKKKEREK